MPRAPLSLRPQDFVKYPPEGRRLASDQVSLLRDLPLGFLPLLLREIIQYDWKFPAERRYLERQLAYVASLSPTDRRAMMAGFADLKLSAGLKQLDWVGDPIGFSEQLTALLWSSRQIDTFHRVANDYVARVDAALPKDALPMSRLGVVFIGRAAEHNKGPLFRKLRARGVFFSSVRPQDGLQSVFDVLGRRANAYSEPFAHWYIDGGAAAKTIKNVTGVSYGALEPVRTALIQRMRKIADAKSMGPEALVTALAQMRPEDLGLSGTSVLNRFEVDLLTQGSGTQVFSTTFVQWAAREALRRAQPVTLVARFAPRQRERPLGELMTGKAPDNELDPQGALIDAEMGGYYNWLNQQRLEGADRGSFVIWFEGHQEALAIGPSFAPGSASSQPLSLAQILDRTAV